MVPVYLTVVCVVLISLPEYFVVSVYLTVCVVLCFSLPEYFVVPVYLTVCVVLCFSLPEYFVVSVYLTNADLQKAAGQYMEKRLPVSSVGVLAIIHCC